MNSDEIKIKHIKNDLEFLRQRSEEVDFSKDDVKSYIDLLDKATKKFNLYAISPVQIGLPKRIIFFRNTNENMDKNFDDEYSVGEVMINPIIKEQIGETLFLEGCGSCYPFCSYVKRPYKILVEYYNELGEKKEETIEGFKATVFSHEFDHLNGILHMDVSNDILILDEKETREKRKYNPYQVISKDGKYERTVNIQENFKFNEKVNKMLEEYI